MSYKVNFLDNQVITAENINSISETLGGGALSFQNETTYGVDALNAISGSLVQKGVSWGCELSAADGKVYISAGMLFMGDGKRVDIDEEGIELDYIPGELNYVWFYRDVAMEFVVPRCTTTEPVGEDYVVLGTITDKGLVTGHAELAVMKNSHLGLNFYEEFSLTIDLKSEDETEVLVGEYQPTQVGGRFLIVVSNESKENYRHNLFTGYVNLQSGQSYGVQATTPGKVSNLDWGVAYGSDADGKLQVSFGNCGGIVYKFYLRFALDSDNILRVYKSGKLAQVSDGDNLPYYQKLTLILC